MWNTAVILDTCSYFNHFHFFFIFVGCFVFLIAQGKILISFSLSLGQGDNTEKCSELQCLPIISPVPPGLAVRNAMVKTQLI